MIIGIIFFALSLIVGGLFFSVINSENNKSVREETEEMEREHQAKEKRYKSERERFESQ